jgi:DNA mismatch repair protein MLH1
MIPFAVLWRLVAEASWESEKDCFASIARELAFFNSPEPLPLLIPADTNEPDERTKQQMSQLKHIVFPAMRYLQPPMSMIDSKAIVHVASLENLYKVFERC